MDRKNRMDLREHDRFALPPMLTSVSVERVHGLRLETLEGHAYDVSEAGMRLELDEPLKPGEMVSLHVILPGEDAELHASARVVWVGEADDDPGPRRAAVRFGDFLAEADRRRLRRFLGSGACHRAA